MNWLLSMFIGDKILAGHFQKLVSWFALSKVITILCSIVVTRLLDPREFAVIASVLAVQGTIIAFTAVNFYSQLIRIDFVSKKQLQVAWSYELLRNVILACILYSLAPLIARAIERPDTLTVFRVTSVQFLLLGLRNPRLLELRRDGKFGILGLQDSVGPVAYAVSSVVFACLRPDYWALVGAGLVSFLLSTISSYFCLAWRPSLDFCWRTVKPLAQFGLVIQLSAIFIAFREHSLVFVLVTMGYPEETGFLNRATTFSTMLAVQIIGIFWKVSYPRFARLANRGEHPAAIAARLQLRMVLIGAPVALIGSGFGVFAIPYVFGAEWKPMGPLWFILVLSSVFLVANSVIDAAWQATKREVLSLKIQAACMTFQLILSFVFVKTYGFIGLGLAVIGANLLCFFIMRQLVLSMSEEEKTVLVESRD